jgi:hypothetical protein
MDKVVTHFNNAGNDTIIIMNLKSVPHKTNN